MTPAGSESKQDRGAALDQGGGPHASAGPPCLLHSAVMKLLLVSPPFGEKGQMSKGLPIAPPVIEYLVGLTRQIAPDVELAVLDANKEQLVPEEVDADAVGFTVLTPQAPWVYRTADALRRLGKKVLLGGIHVSALP